MALANPVRVNPFSILAKLLEGILLHRFCVACVMCLSEINVEALIPLGSIKREDLPEDEECKIDLDKPVFLRLLLSRREAGCIIGKNGETISFLRRKSGAKIKVSDKGLKERTVAVSGGLGSVLRAIKLFCREFAWGITTSVTLESVTNLPKFIFRVLLPVSVCGSLIGQQGENIIKLRRMSGCLLQLTRHKLPFSTDRILFIYGTSAAITKCLKNICWHMVQTKGKSHDIPYIPSSGTSFSCDPVREVPFRNGTLELDVRFLLPQTLDTLQNFSQHSVLETLTVDKVPWTGFVHSLSLPRLPGAYATSIQTLIPSVDPLSGLMQRAPCPEVRKDLVIPNDLVGCVIGRGGIKINEIRRASQATIRISNVEKPQHCCRLVTITGSPTSVESAIGMINASLQCREVSITPSGAP